MSKTIKERLKEMGMTPDVPQIIARHNYEKEVMDSRGLKKVNGQIVSANDYDRIMPPALPDPEDPMPIEMTKNKKKTNQG